MVQEANIMEQIKRGEIYYANLCPVVGSEQGGDRPVIILQNDKGKLSQNRLMSLELLTMQPLKRYRIR